MRMASADLGDGHHCSLRLNASTRRWRDSPPNALRGGSGGRPLRCSRQTSQSRRPRRTVRTARSAARSWSGRRRRRHGGPARRQRRRRTRRAGRVSETRRAWAMGGRGCWRNLFPGAGEGLLYSVFLNSQGERFSPMPRPNICGAARQIYIQFPKLFRHFVPLAQFCTVFGCLPLLEGLRV